MTKKHKLYEKIKNNPYDVTFKDLESILIQKGFTFERITGSHHIFKKGKTIFVVPIHRNKVKVIYVKRLIEIIEKGEEDVPQN